MTKTAANIAGQSGRMELPTGNTPARLLALLHQLESSLELSQRALLDRDFVELDVLTQEQTGLLRALSGFWADGDTTLFPLDQLREAQIRILHLARIQRGILTRLNRRAAVLFHLVAGTRADYSLAAAHSVISLRPIAPLVREA